MHHQNFRPRHAVPDNEIERAAILLPEHATIYRDPRFVAVVWTVDTSDRTTAQVLGCQRRCLPFLARYVSVTTGLGISATALRVRDRAIPTRGEFIATEIECPQCDGQRAHKQARQRAAPGQKPKLVIATAEPTVGRPSSPSPAIHPLAPMRRSVERLRAARFPPKAPVASDASSTSGPPIGACIRPVRHRPHPTLTFVIARHVIVMTPVRPSPPCR